MYERFISSSMLTGIFKAANSIKGGLLTTDYRLRTEPRATRLQSVVCRPRSVLDVKILDVQRIAFDELPARLDLIAHQRGEHQVRFRVVFGLHLQQRPLLRLHRRRPELIGVTIAEDLVTVDCD